MYIGNEDAKITSSQSALWNDALLVAQLFYWELKVIGKTTLTWDEIYKYNFFCPQNCYTMAIELFRQLNAQSLYYQYSK